MSDQTRPQNDGYSLELGATDAVDVGSGIATRLGRLLLTAGAYFA